jgi:heat shock protein HslJ
MACPPEVMEAAAAFMTALSGARSYRVQDGRLQLQDGDGTVLATLDAQQQTLAGTSWEAIGVNNGKGGVVSIATEATITLDFSADGRVSGSAGCNRYTGTWTAEGATVAFGPAAATRRMCPDQAVMEQEQNFLTALGTVRSMRMEGDRLELRAADGALAISARKPAPQAVDAGHPSSTITARR